MKVEDFKFRASNPKELQIGTEVSTKEVVVKGRTNYAILDIEADLTKLSEKSPPFRKGMKTKSL